MFPQTACPRPEVTIGEEVVPGVQAKAAEARRNSWTFEDRSVSANLPVSYCPLPEYGLRSESIGITLDGMPTSNRGRPIVPASWADFYERTHIPAVFADARLYVTGHTGTLDDGTFPEGGEAQIRQTFQNVTVTLVEAGATWDDVIELTTYHVDFSA